MPHFVFPGVVALAIAALVIFFVIGFLFGWSAAFAAVSLGFFTRWCQRHAQDVREKSTEKGISGAVRLKPKDSL
jgi:membrane protein implicated in regulation of membrane protease activity